MALTGLPAPAKSILPQLAAHPHISQRFRSKLDDRTDELVSSLLHDLSNPSIRKSGVVRTTNWLLRLGLGERARETFLSARGVLVKRRTRQIKFEGDISMYISELAMVSFTLIKNTCEWYMAAFKDNSMASGRSPSLPHGSIALAKARHMQALFAGPASRSRSMPRPSGDRSTASIKMARSWKNRSK